MIMLFLPPILFKFLFKTILMAQIMTAAPVLETGVMKALKVNLEVLLPAVEKKTGLETRKKALILLLKKEKSLRLSIQ